MYIDYHEIEAATKCLERAYSALWEASQYPYSITRQCGIRTEAAEAEIAAAMKFLEKAKK